jgi:N-sulfoglucosamine sulfohydrolase
MTKTILLGIFTAICLSAYKPKPIATTPNILWITCEDMSPHLGCFGETVAKTPNLDKLATEGVRYTNVFSTAGVCAPSRSALITGCYQTSIGTQHMRTGGFNYSTKSAYPPNYTGYSAVIPPEIKCFPEYLRCAGYYCTNNDKQDYQFDAPPTVWDENSKKAHWRKRKNENQPFFSVFNIMVTHESQIWGRAKEPLWVNPKDVIVPPYYPDNALVRQDIARHLSNVMDMDKQVGQIIKELKEDGLYDNTIIFFFSDHGDALPFVKREITHRGLKVPMIIRNPYDDESKMGTIDNQLISFIDLPPSVLSLTEVAIPKYMQGQVFIGNKKAKEARKYIYAARDRMDSEYDRVRSVSDGRFQYLKNYMPEKPYYQNINYRLQVNTMKELLRLRAENQLNETQMQWFRPTKPNEELYDTENDPYQLKNLTDNPEHAAKLKELRTAHEVWTKKYGDMSAVSENAMRLKWWNGQNEAPKTTFPRVQYAKNYVKIQCDTEGASIGYRKSALDSWAVYQKPVVWNRGDSLYVVAHRIGYQPSVVFARVVN